MHTYNYNRVNVAEFSSLDDMLETLEGSSGTHGHDEGTPTWAGTETWGEAVALGRDGWQAIRPDVDRLLDGINGRLRDVLPHAFDMGRDVAGTFVDMGAFMTGEPECMTFPVPSPLMVARSAKVVRIHYNTGANATADPDAMIKRGVAIIALVDALASLGVNCEIWTESACKKGRRSASVLTCQKRAGESVDINRLMFALANPSFHRRLTFAARVVCGNLAGVERGGDCQAVPLLMDEKVQADVVISRSHSNSDPTVVDPEGWVLGELERLGFSIV